VYTVTTTTTSTSSSSGSRVGSSGSGVIEDTSSNAWMGLPQYVAYKFSTGYPAVAAVVEDCVEKINYAKGPHQVAPSLYGNGAP